MELLALASLIGWWLALHALVRREAELLLFAVVAAVMAALYLAGLAGCLQAGARTIYWLGLGLVAPGLYWHLQARPELLKGLAAPGPVIFLVGVALFWLRFHDFTYYMWDEFSNWGLMAKEIAAGHGLLGPGTQVSVSDYPPAAALFQYFFLAGGPFKEGATYLAQFVALFAPLTLMYRGLGWRRWGWLGLLLGGQLFFLHLLGQGLVSIYLDTVLGVFFAMAVWAWFSLKSRPAMRAYLLPVIFVLPLLKPIAIIFALAAMGLFGMDALICAWGARKWPASKNLGQSPQWPARWWPTLALLAVLSLAAAASQQSWAVYVSATGLGQLAQASEQISLDQAAKALSAQPGPRAAQVRQQFWLRLAQDPNGNVRARHRLLNILRKKLGAGGGPQDYRLTIPAWCLLSGLLVLGAGWVGRDSLFRLRAGVLWGGLCLGLAAYLFALLLSYIFLFKAYEAGILTCFARYVNSYLLAMCLLGLALLVRAAAGGPKASQTGPQTAVLYWITAGGLAILMVGETPTEGTGPYLHRAAYAPVRAPLRPLVEEVQAHAGPQDPVFIVYQGSKGFEHRVLFYELAPRRGNAWNWSIAGPAFEGDVWSADWTAQRWQKELAKGGFLWVLIARADEPFWRRFGSMFHPGTHRGRHHLFKVTQGPDGLRLVPAPTP